ncbi:TniB family NTP-binding protein [Vibrio cholerae]|uniref:TniB family NTP-binding protein n=1 Tax=Vibrio cholerae TaxID=666 RepID=UPI0004E3FBED|nr:TniB family NTP-binding protein [Vibrio cholerae]KFE19324.1 AAA domain protein [Vibrio cholerae]TXZ44665.1 AAA family ATPase [Vibrio cholerae]GHX66506.1 ATP-binding protein [Vibrio cholerae]
MEHVSPKLKDFLSLDNDQRIAEIRRKKWIGYTSVNLLLARMEDLLNYPKTHRMPNLLIKSETNNGKSFVLKKFLKAHPVYEDPRLSRYIFPVVSIEIPPDPSPDIIYSLILQAMRIPYRESYKKEIKARKVFEAFSKFGVRMLLIDELHVLMNATRLKKAQLLDTLKYIGNQTEIVIVAAGTMEAHTAIISDGQLANRFEPFVLPHWKLNTEFRKLLATFEKVLPLKEPSQLQSQILSTEIYSMSGGWIGEVDEILTRAAIEAIQSGEEKITLQILRKINWQSPEQRRLLTI